MKRLEIAGFSARYYAALAVAHFSHHRTGLTDIVRERTFRDMDAVFGVLFVSVMTGESVAKNSQIYDRSKRTLHLRPIRPVRCERFLQDREIVAAGRR